jgi:hypothetical protein
MSNANFKNSKYNLTQWSIFLKNITLEIRVCISGSKEIDVINHLSRKISRSFCQKKNEKKCIPNDNIS